MNIAKHKDKARTFEVKNQTDKAIEAYVEIIQALDGTPELDDELALFNKVGDLYQKAGNVQSAVDMWERGVNHYAEGGFHNNAIALCNKILRNAPGRTEVYLTLAKLMLGRGFAAEAKQNLLEYAERMKKVGQLDAAFKALKEFADLSSNNEDIRLLLAEQLKSAGREDEAREQLAKLYHETKGDARRSRVTMEKMKVIDPEFDVENAPQPKVKPKAPKSSDLVFLDVGDDAATQAPPVPSGRAPAARPAAPAPPPQAAPAPPKAAPPPPKAAPAPPKAAPPPLKAAPAPPKAAPPPPKAAPAPPKVAPKPPPRAPEPELVEIETTSLLEEPEPVDEGDLRIERASVELDTSAAGAGTMDGLMGSSLESPGAELLDLEPTALEESAAAPMEEAVEGGDAPMIEVPELEIAAPDEPAAATAGLEVPELDLGGFGEEPAAGGVELPLVETESVLDLNIEVAPLGTSEEVAPPDVDTLEAQVASNPDDPQLHQSLGEALLETGQRERGLEELDIGLGRFEAQEDWVQAEDLADEILRLDPNSVRHHQKRVEYAFRRNDKGRLIEAYLGLSDALMRSGAMDRARAVYQRVLEHDPQNARALSALSTLEPPPEEKKPVAKKPAAPAAAGDFIDLGSLIMDDAPIQLGDARLRVQDEEPTGDEQRDFDDMLTQFKKGIEASLGVEDVQAHYDLGVAFKEMGLIDEAIGEFQKALRGAEGRLRTSEALGTCFFEKGQFNVAATVLRRAVETDSGGDEQKIGLLYWLGRCEEEMSRPHEALTYYQRVFAVDIGFQDVSSRVKSLAKAGK